MTSRACVDGVFRSVAHRYDLMNDLMSGGLHRAWKDALVTAVDPPKNRARFALLDLAGGTGDIASASPRPAAPGTRVTVCDINPDMLNVGRERAAERGLEDDCHVRTGQCRRAGLSDRSSSTRRPLPSVSALCRASTYVAQAYRVLKLGGRFLCLEFSSVDMPGLDALYELYSFQ